MSGQVETTSMRIAGNNFNRILHPFLLVIVLTLPMVAGCGGCRNQEPLDKKNVEDAKKEKPKPDFELTSITVLPSILEEEEEEEEEPKNADDEAGIRKGESIFDSLVSISRTAVKPGHWIEVRHRLRANNFDFVGDLNSRVLDRGLNSVTLERSPFRIVSSRPMSLPKEQQKYIDVPLFVPAIRSGDSRLAQIDCRLESRNGVRAIDFGAHPTVRLNAHQFFFVVLADNPDRYGYLKTLTVVRPPCDTDDEWDALPGDYAVKLIDAEQPLPLPSGSLAWTATAYVLWDDLNPDVLSSDQQRAMLDWLHWGGRLIVSGPKSLERLRGSFLEEYLPATADRTLTIDQAVVDELNKQWVVYPQSPKRQPDQYHLKLNDRPLEVTQLRLTDGASFLENTSQLVAERRVGRGVVVVTSFSMTDRRMVNWPGFDSFFNGCLMRRDARRFSQQQGLDVTNWENSTRYRDALKMSGLRYFVRDAQSRAGEIALTLAPNKMLAKHVDGEFGAKDRSVDHFDKAGTDSAGFLSDSVAGVAGWTDFSAAATAARGALQTSSGINVPNRQFVARVLGGYLFCLVPLNWMIFRWMGRVEWAWFAAPVIAVLGGIGIVKMAELDIGFVRARTELAVVELQQGYSRAHVARFTGLYTSLSSAYTVKFDDPSAVVAPFSTNPSYDQLRLQRQQDVRFRQDSSVGLSGFPVISNTTGMVHAEQFVEMDGTLRLLETEHDLQVRNTTGFEFDGSVALHRVSNTNCEVAIIGPLSTGETAVNFGRFDENQLLEYLNSDPVTAAAPGGSGSVSLRGMIRVACSWNQIDVGEYRFIGWNDQEVAGMTVKPASNQSNFRTLFVGNIKYGQLPQPEADKNLYEEFRTDESTPID